MAPRAPTRIPTLHAATQICQPGAEANQETLYQMAFHRLKIKRNELPAHALIVAEPFRLAAASQACAQRARSPTRATGRRQ